MAKNIIFANEARNKIMEGVDTLANAAKVTLGPKGKCVIIRDEDPTFTRDGVTVANNIDLEDKVEQMACLLVKGIATKTDQQAGDGTTTAILLSQFILKEGLKAIAAGMDTIKVKEGITRAVKLAVDIIEKTSTPLKTKEQIINIGTIASRERRIGETIADIIEKLGKEAIIAVEESKVMGLNKEIVEGMQFDHGFISPYFMTNSEKGEAILEDPYILTTTQAIKSNQEIIRLLEDISKTEKKSLVVISDDISGEALASLVINKMRGMMNIVAVKAPGVGDDKRNKLEDIAIMTGGKFVSEEVGLKVEDVELADLGRADKVIVNKGQTLIIGGKGKKAEITKRVNNLKGLISDEDSDYRKEIMTQRMAKLKGGVAMIKVGTVSEQENKEMRFRIEDAVLATKSAIEEGIVPGGGMTLIKCSDEIEKISSSEKDMGIRTGMEIIQNAIREPARQILMNAGKKPDVILNEIDPNGSTITGYDSSVGEYCNLVKAGIIDSAKVVRSSLQNAVSIVSLFLITEAIITTIPEEKNK